MIAVPQGSKDETGGQRYHLSHPMLFQVRSNVNPDTPGLADVGYEESSEVFVVEVKGLIPRVVIHMVKTMINSAPGEECVAGYASRVVEGISNAHMALMLQGYQVN